jgi:AraC-like DNA-binding protein
MQTDPLSDAVRLIRLRTAAYDQGYLRGRWGIRLQAVDGATFCAVSSGETFLGTEALSTPLCVTGGDVVLLPHGPETWLKDEPERHLSPTQEGGPFTMHAAPASRAHDPMAASVLGSKSVSVVAGILQFDTDRAAPLLQSLPPVIHLPRRQTAIGRWLTQTLSMLNDELCDPTPGSAALVTWIFGTLFIQTLRSLITKEARSLPEGHLSTGLVRGLQDRHVGAALHAFHRMPASDWTVETLADHAHLSRTAFATRFKQHVGKTPMRYVRQYRMHRASLLLEEQPAATVNQIAWDVGYESVSSFIKAFQREMGGSPSAFRRRSR